MSITFAAGPGAVTRTGLRVCTAGEGVKCTLRAGRLVGGLVVVACGGPGERTVSLRSDSWDSRGEACLATHVLVRVQDMSVAGIERASWSLEACKCGLWRRATDL